MFCIKCGQKLADKAAYCSACGAIVKKSVAADQESRKQVYAGEMKKCPNCGEVLSAFEVTCHSCGFEIRNAAASTAVQRLEREIAKIEASRVDYEKAKNSVWRVFRKEDEVNPIDKSIANTIHSFVIPNTKEDILEFMILASSNIDTDVLDDRSSSESRSRKLITNAWIAKFEQSYQKAKLAFGNSPDFDDINAIYEKRKKEIHRGRTKSSRELLFMLAICVGLMLLLLIIGKLGGSSTQDSSAASQENPKKSMEELKKDTEEFKEIIDEYKSIFSGIFD